MILKVRMNNRINFYSKFKQIIYELFLGLNYYRIDNKKIAKCLGKKNVNKIKIDFEKIVENVNDKKCRFNF